MQYEKSHSGLLSPDVFEDVWDGQNILLYDNVLLKTETSSFTLIKVLLKSSIHYDRAENKHKVLVILLCRE